MAKSSLSFPKFSGEERENLFRNLAALNQMGRLQPPPYPSLEELNLPKKAPCQTDPQTKEASPAQQEEAEMTQEPNRGARQLNVTLPRFTLDQIDALCDHWGMTKTQLVIVAIERMTQDMERGEDSSADLDAASEVAETSDGTLED